MLSMLLKAASQLKWLPIPQPCILDQIGSLLALGLTFRPHTFHRLPVQWRKLASGTLPGLPVLLQPSQALKLLLSLQLWLWLRPTHSSSLTSEPQNRLLYAYVSMNNDNMFQDLSHEKCAGSSDKPSIMGANLAHCHCCRACLSSATFPQSAELVIILMQSPLHRQR